jgi:ubiquinone/menaquinone biosynthesis C-methylase UbiE
MSKTPGWENYIAETMTIKNDLWVREFAAMMKPLPKKINKMLEVGCSGGRWIFWYEKRHKVKEAHGVDIYDVMKIHEKSDYKLAPFKFKKADARKLPYKKSEFDFVYSLGLVEHFKNPDDVEKIIAEQARVLKKGGHIVTTFPTLNYDALNYWLVKIKADPFHSYKHYNTTIKKVIKIYERHGLEVIDAKYLGWFFEPFNVPRITRARQFSQIACIVGRKV